MQCCALLLAAAFVLFAAEPMDILEAARQGKPKEIAAQLAKGTNIETRDKDGRTPLMLAAQHGRTSTVRLLLEKGAKADARDSQNWNAYMLALLSPIGGALTMHEPVLKLLPQPKRMRVAITARWSPGTALFSSCFMGPEELVQHLRRLHPDGMVIEALQHFGASSGRDLIAIVSADARGNSEISERPTPKDVDAVLTLQVEPGVSCVQRLDRLNMSVQATLTAPDGQSPLFEKTFAAGLKFGMRGQPATNPNQHGPIWESWAKSQAGPLYWAVVTALLQG